MSLMTSWSLVGVVFAAWVVGILYGAHLACKHLGADYADLLGGERHV